MHCEDHDRMALSQSALDTVEGLEISRFGNDRFSWLKTEWVHLLGYRGIFCIVEILVL